MKLIGIDVIDGASRMHPNVKKPLDTWRALVQEAQWKTPYDLKAQFGTADILGGGRVVFNIKGNNYRLLVRIDYQIGLVIIKRFGTHQEYNSWNL